MRHDPPPTIFRSEAFAEDLLDSSAATGSPWQSRRAEALLGLLPLCTALLGFAFALF
jgi:hypothetical protein